MVRTQSNAFRFDPEKAIQAAAVLLRTEPTNEMNYMKLLKLMYIADREAIKETLSPITGDRAVAMERGPVLSGVYNLIKGEHVAAPKWSAEFVQERFMLHLLGDVPVDKLSRYEIAKLNEVAKRFRDFDEWAMVKECHKSLPEWSDPGPKRQSPITLSAILRAVGRAKDETAILEQERADAAIDKFFKLNNGIGTPHRPRNRPHSGTRR